jgi:cytochrome c oxidase assembly protein subunit 15
MSFQMNQQFVKKLAIAATAFALVVVLLGAFTRLSHAGLGCPDWPGCYGFSHIPTEQKDISAANEAFPERPYEFAKAWPEMVHRYFAGTLGLLVLGLAVLSFKRENSPAKKHSIALLILIIFQAALGMWTVTMKLHPGIVMTHLMGGLTTFMLLGSLSLRYIYQFENRQPIAERYQFKMLSMIVFVVLILQVALGGWTSANYAATICYELPICQGEWWQQSDFMMGFTIWGHGAEDYEFGILDSGARIAIHSAHRIGAIVTSIVMALLCFKLIQQSLSSTLKKFGLVLSTLLIIQVTLGVFNIIFDLPLYNAVAHNGVGAILLLTMAILMTYLVMPEKPSLNQGAKHD